MLQFASSRQRDEWASGSIAPLLGFLLLLGAHHAVNSVGFTPIVTSIYRSLDEDKLLGASGIHPAWRAVDIAAFTWLDPKVQALADFINTQVVYDPARPAMLAALFQPHESATGPHLHLQVHPSSHLVGIGT